MSAATVPGNGLAVVLDAGGAGYNVLGSNIACFVVTGTGTVQIKISVDGATYVLGAYASGNQSTVGSTTLAPNDIAIPYTAVAMLVQQHTLTGSPIVTMQLAEAPA